MTEILVRGTSLPSIFTERPEARTRMRDFFSSHIRNPNTRQPSVSSMASWILPRSSRSTSQLSSSCS